MQTKIFKGSINGVQYTSLDEFNSALAQFKPEDLKQVSSSFEIVEENDPVVEGTQRIEDKVYNTEDVLGKLFSSIFPDLVTNNPAKKELPTVNTADYIVNCNLDKFTADEDENEKMLDDYSELLYDKEQKFDALSDVDKNAVREAVKTKVAELQEKLEVTNASLESLNEKVMILEKSVEALELLDDYYDYVLENE